MSNIFVTKTCHLCHIRECLTASRYCKTCCEYIDDDEDNWNNDLYPIRLKSPNRARTGRIMPEREQNYHHYNGLYDIPNYIDFPQFSSFNDSPMKEVNSECNGNNNNNTVNDALLSTSHDVPFLKNEKVHYETSVTKRKRYLYEEVLHNDIRKAQNTQCKLQDETTYFVVRDLSQIAEKSSKTHRDIYKGIKLLLSQLKYQNCWTHRKHLQQDYRNSELFKLPYYNEPQKIRNFMDTIVNREKHPNGVIVSKQDVETNYTQRIIMCRIENDTGCDYYLRLNI